MSQRMLLWWGQDRAEEDEIKKAEETSWKKSFNFSQKLWGPWPNVQNESHMRWAKNPEAKLGISWLPSNALMGKEITSKEPSMELLNCCLCGDQSQGLEYAGRTQSYTPGPAAVLPPFFSLLWFLLNEENVFFLLTCFTCLNITLPNTSCRLLINVIWNMNSFQWSSVPITYTASELVCTVNLGEKGASTFYLLVKLRS